MRREQFIVWIDGEPWSAERFDPYQNYLCETETSDPPFSCNQIACYELVHDSADSMDDLDAASRLYLCETCLEKLKDA